MSAIRSWSACGTRTHGCLITAGFGGGGFAVSNGTQVIPFTKTQDTDSSTSGGAKTTISFNHISAMKAYETKSPEELRWEDYQV